MCCINIVKDEIKNFVPIDSNGKNEGDFNYIKTIDQQKSLIKFKILMKIMLDFKVDK